MFSNVTTDVVVDVMGWWGGSGSAVRRGQPGAAVRQPPEPAADRRDHGAPGRRPQRRRHPGQRQGGVAQPHGHRTGRQRVPHRLAVRPAPADHEQPELRAGSDHRQRRLGRPGRQRHRVHLHPHGHVPRGRRDRMVGAGRHHPPQPGRAHQPGRRHSRCRRACAVAGGQVLGVAHAVLVRGRGAQRHRHRADPGRLPHGLPVRPGAPADLQPQLRAGADHRGLGPGAPRPRRARVRCSCPERPTSSSTCSAASPRPP